MEQAIFITGGASGIGRAVAKLFAERGWRVGLADVNARGLDETRALLPAERSSVHVMDVRDRTQWVDALTEFTALSGGRLDVLFNNAGVAVGGPFAETPVEDIDRCLAININGVINGAHCGHPFLKATPGSCLLNTASAAGIYGVPNGAVYAATKFAVRGFTESLDGEWVADGIKVHSLMPAFIDTPLLEGTGQGSNETMRERVRNMGLEISPVEDVAKGAWDAVHGDRVHTLVGATARRLAFAARWLPGQLRKQVRGGRGF